MPDSYQEQWLAQRLELVAEALARAAELLNDAKSVVSSQAAASGEVLAEDFHRESWKDPL